ncbi:MAG: methionyl-tRNA formyltransferase [Phycisphaerae bacterium]
MRLVLWARGARGAACLEALLAANRRPRLLVLDPRAADSDGPLVRLADAAGIERVAPDDANDEPLAQRIRGEVPDVMVLAGYGRILKPATLALARLLTINLHAGRLPQYRGSSPMNWALINGDDSFALSIIRVDAGIDTGDILAERSFPVGPDDTIVDLHRVAQREFPSMLLDVLAQVEAGSLAPRKQDEAFARYYPLRFPDDGLVLWDVLTARQVHDRVRALRPPYPGAFTYSADRRVTLISSAMCETRVYGEPGRVYRVGPQGALVCAADRCLWIREARFADDGTSWLDCLRRYDQLGTLRGAALHFYSQNDTLGASRLREDVSAGVRPQARTAPTGDRSPATAADLERAATSAPARNVRHAELEKRAAEGVSA